MERNGIPVSKWKMTEEEQKLAIENLPWVIKYAFKMDRSKYGCVMSFDDILSHCSEGLCKAVMTYDPGKNYDFNKHIRNHIRWAIQHTLQKRKKSVDSVSLGERQIPCIEYRVEANELLERATKELSESERVIFRLRFIEGYKLREIGEVLNISRERVHQRIKTIIKKLKRENNVHCCIR